MDDATLANLGVTDYLLCNFENPEFGGIVGVYVGYHASQVREEGWRPRRSTRSTRPPTACRDRVGTSSTIAWWSSICPACPRLPATVRRLVIARGDDRQLTYYWYQSRGRVVSQDWKKILYVGFDRAVRSRTDGSLVRFTVPILRKDEATAEASFYDLAPRVLALLPAYVPD